VWRELVWSQWSEDHIAEHNVLPDEVEQVVNSRPRFTAKGRDETTIVYGRTDAGRYLLVVLAEGLAGGWHVVTARDMDDAERRIFDRKGA
jgi:hypothetical protein